MQQVAPIEKGHRGSGARTLSLQPACFQHIHGNHPDGFLRIVLQYDLLGIVELLMDKTE
ncbi:MAG TPA: hypothetical protein VFY29_17845 [Terriglobia bacterium]|nr:hypothetical protein [Terriglobia bacterium]